MNTETLQEATVIKKFELTPMEMVFRYIKYLPWVLVAAAISLVLALLHLRYTPVTYSAKGQMIIKSESPISTGDEKFNSLFLMDAGPNLNNEMIILRSSSLLQRVVEDLGLYTEYTGYGTVMASLLYRSSPVILEVLQQNDSTKSLFFNLEIVDSARYRMAGFNEDYFFGQPFKTEEGVFKINYRKIELGLNAPKEFLIAHYPPDVAAERLASSVSVAKVNEQTNILDLSVTSTNMALAADVVNSLMKEYAELTVEDKNTIAYNTIRFIETRLDSLQSELSGVEGNIQRFQERNKGIGLEAQSGQYIATISSLEENANQLEVRKKIISWLQEYMRSAQNRHTTVPVNLGVDEPTLVPLISNYNELQVKRAALLKSTTELNPTVVELTTSVDKLRTDIEEALSSVARSYDISLNQLQSRLNVQQSLATSLPGKTRQLLNIERQQKIKEELYLLLLSKKEEVAVGAASILPNSAVLEKATKRGKLVGPVEASVYFKFLLAGILIPIALIVLKEYLNDKVMARADIERRTDVPIVGEIGRSQDENTLLVTKSNRSFITEQFRAIRSNMSFLTNSVTNPVILITSSMSGEGKSFVSTNVAAAYALAGKKALLLEFDIRKPKLSANLNIQAKKGLSTYLVTTQDPEEFVIKVPEVDGLYIFPCGFIPPNPSEILLFSKMEALFKWARSNFDVVIIDSAPVGVVSDAVTLSKYADVTLYILRQGHTIKKMLDMVENMYHQKRLPGLALVVNDVNTKGGYGYGYGYGYGDAKIFGEYFEHDKAVRKRSWKNWFK